MGLQMAQFDVKTAFLHGELEEEIFVKLPEGFHMQGKEKVLKLKKGIYGLKQSPRCWNKKLGASLHQCGLNSSASDPSVFVGHINGALTIIAIYVDDGLILSSDNSIIEDLLKQIGEKFAISKGTVSKYIGLEIERDDETGSIFIGQQQYVEELLMKFRMEECNPTSVPLQPYTDLNAPDKPNESLPYRQLIGSLIFLAKCTRPDIAFAVSRLAQYMGSYDESHFRAAKGVLRYLKGTSDMGIIYKGGLLAELIGYTDSDYAGDKLTRKTTSGFVFLFGGSPVTWSSQKQPCVAMSSTEAEYIALAGGTKEAIWLRAFLGELGLNQPTPTKIKVDNQSAIKLIKNPKMHSRTKHIEVKFHFSRDHSEKEDILVEYVPTEDQLADGLTKPLLKGKLELNRSKLGILRKGETHV